MTSFWITIARIIVAVGMIVFLTAFICKCIYRERDETQKVSLANRICWFGLLIGVLGCGIEIAYYLL